MSDLAVTPSEIIGASRLGTRFLVFPQPSFLPGYERPEVVWLSTPPGSIGPGPSDHRMYVVDPVLSKQPYSTPYLPPFSGDARAPAVPGPDGHFDHLSIGTPEFASAHAFACVRRVLDVCESYLEHEIPWFFSQTYERLEIVPHLAWDNAQSGFGFLELGEDGREDTPFPFALNFDVIAHETGHLVLFGTLGLPSAESPTGDFLAYHETVADFLALISLLHFDTALDRMLRRTRGNLLITNELDHLAELTDERAIRVASHSLRLSDVGREVHDYSKPFVGALFDGLLEVFQLIMVERGLASFDTRQISEVRFDLNQADIERELAISRDDYNLRHFAVKSALMEARDIIGESLVKSWAKLAVDNFSFRDAAQAMLATLEAGRGRRFADRVFDEFVWREIL
jgi:hypothetical protein